MWDSSAAPEAVFDEIDDAFRWIERAIDHNDGWVPALKSYPFVDPLRADPRFHALLRKMNLEA